MNVTVREIDSSRLRGKLNDLYEVMLGQGKDVSRMLLDEGVLLNKRIVSFVPPIKANGRGPKAAGEMAVHRDVNRVFQEASPALIATIAKRCGTSNVNTWVTNKDGTKENLQWANVDASASRMDSLHQSFRNPRTGQVSKNKSALEHVWKARVIVPTGSIAPYEAKVKARVGRARASMAYFGARNGAKFPAWITRHFGSVSDVAIADTQNLMDPRFPRLAFGSRAPGINRVEDRIQGAVKSRINAISTKIKLMLNGYKKDFQTPGARISPRAASVKSPEETVE